jgi:hypothetical protein
MPVLWKLFVEISVKPEDFPSKSTLGFMNVITWADSAEEGLSKLTAYLKKSEWEVLTLEEAVPVDDNLIYSDEMAEMIERARNNPQAIILGIFHSYKTN